jgi:hypothetical protein
MSTLSVGMVTMSSQLFRVRDARSTGSDVDFILSAWDSSLPFLESIGAGEMWGQERFSQRQSFVEDVADIIRKSETNPESDERRILIAECLDDDNRHATATPIGFAMIRDTLPYYLTGNEALNGELGGARSLLFIEVLISDRQPDRHRPSTGSALVEAIMNRAKASEKTTVYVDAWAGNDRKLNKFVQFQRYRLKQ